MIEHHKFMMAHNKFTVHTMNTSIDGPRGPSAIAVHRPP
jgi:hypothetical protein